MKLTTSQKRLIKRIKNKVKDHLFEDGKRIKIGFSFFTDTIIKEVRRAERRVIKPIKEENHDLYDRLKELGAF